MLQNSARPRRQSNASKISSKDNGNAEPYDSSYDDIQSSTPRQLYTAPKQSIRSSSQLPQSSSASMDLLAGKIGSLKVSSPMSNYNSYGSAGIPGSSGSPYTYVGSPSSSTYPQDTSSLSLSSSSIYPPSSTVAAGGSQADASLKNVAFMDFRVRDRAFYATPGRMFVIKWSEPASDQVSTAASTAHIRDGALGEPVFQKQRLFVVVKTMDRHSLVLAIHTHEGRGVARIPHKDHYGIIYTGRVAPGPKAAELDKRGRNLMQPEAVRVMPDLRTDNLDPMSRLNYAKVYTVEHRMKARPFGILPEASRTVLTRQLKNVLGIDLDAPTNAGGQQAPQQGQSTSASNAGPATASRPQTQTSSLPMLDNDGLLKLHASLMSEKGFSTEQATAVIRSILQRQMGSGAQRT